VALLFYTVNDETKIRKGTYLKESWFFVGRRAALQVPCLVLQPWALELAYRGERLPLA